jgi:hypothetical protein
MSIQVEKHTVNIACKDSRVAKPSLSAMGVLFNLGARMITTNDPVHQVKRFLKRKQVAQELISTVVMSVRASKYVDTYRKIGLRGGTGCQIYGWRFMLYRLEES